MERQAIIQQGMCVAVMGLGITGQAAVRYSLGCGARVLGSDSRAQEHLEQELAEFLRDTGVELEAGGHTVDFLRQADLVIVSPGIPPDHEVIRKLTETGVTVVGELAVVAPQLDMPVVAITGTNGKTTVTSLIGEILEEAGKKVFIGGNIGTPIFDCLRNGTDAEVMVLEVSSFQLQMAGDFTPDVGVLLNITPDHLDRHGSIAAYAEAKMELFRRQRSNQTAVLCADDRQCLARINDIAARICTFGSGSDCNASIVGLTVTVQCGKVQDEYDLSGTALGNAIGVRNAAAAALAAQALGIQAEDIRRGLRGFEPGPHRLQLVAELDGVRFVNDSKATNTGAVIAALQQTVGKALLIAGGRDKGEDYGLLREIVREKARAVIVIGEAGEKIRTALEDCARVLPAATLEEAARLGKTLAQSGDTVLLSPACASFDMFKSYGHRGEMFAAAVEQLRAEVLAVAGGGQ